MKVLAVDWGERRMGFAVSDETATIAFPLAVVECGSEKQRKRAVLEKIDETGAGLLVVGLPLTLSGKEGESASQVRAFFTALEKACRIPALLWDERMTTVIAHRVQKEKGDGRGKKKRGGGLDSLASSVLLQSYLDFNKTNGGE